MRCRTWPVAAFGLGGLLLLIVFSIITLSRTARDIYSELERLNLYHDNVDATLRSLRSDVNVSGIFIRDYLLDVARDHSSRYRERLAEFRRTNVATLQELRRLDSVHWKRIASLESRLDGYWQTFEPPFDWTRMLWAWLSRTWRDWRSAMQIVRPETVVAWHRRGFRLFWTGEAAGAPHDRACRRTFAP